MQDVSSLVSQAREGRPRAVARLISLVEGAAPQLREVMAALAPLTGNAYVVGLTGSPGVGKSTSTSALVTAYRRQGKRVGVLAVDPSSPFSGGALLGDRVRMSDHSSDPGVYIRSMATRGHLGGLAWSAPQAIRVLDAAGCDVILVETVGVGQSEVEIARQADTSVVLLAPGMGDGIQAAKAGILEIGDVYVVNKADRDGADATARELNHMLGLGESRGPGAWRPRSSRRSPPARRASTRWSRPWRSTGRGWRSTGSSPNAGSPGVPGGRDDRRHDPAPAHRRPARRPPPQRPRRTHRRRRTGPLPRGGHPRRGPHGELNPARGGHLAPARRDVPRRPPHDAARPGTPWPTPRARCYVERMFLLMA